MMENMTTMTRSTQYSCYFSRPIMMAVILLSILMLSACSSGKDLIGGKNAPDEFEVVIRPPLTLPPNFSLRPTDDVNDALTATLAQTQSQTSVIGQSVSLFGTTQTANASSFEELFGTDEITPNIRNIIDEETLGIQLERRIPLEQIFGGKPEVGPDLDAAAEAFRIRQAIKDGKSLTDSPTFATDPLDGVPLVIE